ncbi:histidinol-phosphate transaminase [Verticiella sediminum]|uniref:Histidinol-phosphate aminotransferase n=1 Tax=Verticiella sediminum TaxID=1247510 RepID=A0A556AG89_9BURK|nr:histidinol-phosphate transaminase [Verticiella sediminum]TSH91895.1 histidinol-phosphate transaminase [Verticiella sediminum]
MSQFWSPIVSQLKPYIPGEQPRIDQLVKLNTNENPYGPSPNAIAVMRDMVNDNLRLYPDPHSSAFAQAVAKRHGVALDHVFVGNGSDEVLAHVFMALLNTGKPLQMPDITYSFYPSYCLLYGIRHDAIPLNARYEIDLNDYRADAGPIIFANPNAPTGHLLGPEAIEKLVKRVPNQLVVVDEAYIDFGGKSAVPLTKQYRNLLVVQTLSKSRSLAGLRVGYAIGHPELIEGLERVKNSFNSYPLGRVAQAGAAAAFEDDNWFRTTREKIMNSRHDLIQALEKRGFEVLPSYANFVFARHTSRDGAELAQALRERAVLVRHFKLPRIEQFLRISIGTEAQCAAFVKALDAILGR